MITRELRQLIMGLDIGQKVDRTVITLLERLQDYADDPFEGRNKVGKPVYRLAYMQRLPLDTPTPMQVDTVKRTYERIMEKYNKDLPVGKPKTKPTLIMDLGHTGQSHFDEYLELGMNVYGINFLGEAATSDRRPDRRIYGVRKVDLTSALAVLLENKRLIIPGNIPDRKLIIAELSRFTWKRTQAGQLTAENLRDTDHDDIVSSLMVACWYGEKGLWEPMDPKTAKAFRDIVMSVDSKIPERPKSKAWHADIPWERGPGQESYVKTSPRHKPKE